MSEKAEKIKETLLAAFPELRCLRCGNDAFSLTYGFDTEVNNRAKLSLFRALSENKDLSLPRSDELQTEVIDTMFVTIICERCGMIERYLRPVLESAEKPIEFAKADNDKAQSD